MSNRDKARDRVLAVLEGVCALYLAARIIPALLRVFAGGAQ